MPARGPRISPAAGPDCNGNGINDLYEIRMGIARDCQGDGIPDECQLATEWAYRHDDGIAEGQFGWGEPYYCWMTQYTVRPGHAVVTEVEIGRGSVAPGTMVTVGVWRGVGGSMDPSSVLLLSSVDVVLDWPGNAPTIRVDVPDTFLGSTGTPFFVGVLGAFQLTDTPLSTDFSKASHQSWIIGSGVPILPDDPAANMTSGGSLSNADLLLRALSCPSGHCGELVDTDFDHIADSCQPQDCNGNGVPDQEDIALGTSLDCQGDGIPDECQTDPGLVVYAYDEGGLGNAVGTNHDYYAWLSPHVVQPGGEVVTDIEVAWGYMEPNNHVTVCLWSDPDGDGDPTDAQLILGYPATSVLEGSGQYVLVNIPDTFVGPAGTSFFVGAYGFFEWDPSEPAWYAAGFDPSSPDLNAWFVSADAPIDLNDLSAGAAEYGRLNAVCSCDGDWTIRAISCATGHCRESADLNGNLSPDECDPDCNGNGIPDDLDIAVGLETDCDMDGVPDSCQSFADCDANGLSDLCQSTTPGGLAGEYYASRDLLGAPIGRLDPQVDFDFSTAPHPPGLTGSAFSARWTGSILPTVAGVHAFSVLRQGPARLWVNGVLLVDEWVGQGAVIVDSVNTIPLSAGVEYQLRLEWRNAGGGAVQLRWQPPGGSLAPIQPSETRPIYDRNHDGVPDVCQLVSDCNGNLVEDLDDILDGALDCDANSVPDSCQTCEDRDGNGWLDSCEAGLGSGLAAQYFLLDPLTLEFRTRVLASVDPVIDIDWGVSAPVGLPVDRFGVRWTGTLTTPPVSGNYGFHLESGEGARLWIDGVLVIDAWAGTGTFSASVNLAASSSHVIRVDYRETGGLAAALLEWTVPGSARAVVPSSALSPGTDLNGDGIPDHASSDCNGNGIPDGLDVDLDGNCVPDDCEGGTGYWRFEEPSGTTIFDETASGLDGALSAIPTRVSDVPVAVVPQTGAANTQAIDNGFIGSAHVPDSGQLLSVPDGSFTLEAWVKLYVISNSDSTNDRQWLFHKKPHAGNDALLEYGFLVQAGDLGALGNELAFRYGDGTSVFTKVSSLTIQDGDWHFVSLAYDADRLLLRFGIDGLFDTASFDKPIIGNVGELVLAAHENAQGFENQWLFGAYDEARFTRAFLPPEDLLDHNP